MGLQPCHYFLFKLSRELNQFVGIGVSCATCIIVFDLISFGAARFKVICVFGAVFSQNQRQCLQSPEVGQILRWAVTGCVKKNRTELECCIVGDSKTPVGRDFPGAPSVRSRRTMASRSPISWRLVLCGRSQPLFSQSFKDIF
jgi:hypothetical protein